MKIMQVIDMLVATFILLIAASILQVGFSILKIIALISYMLVSNMLIHIFSSKSKTSKSKAHYPFIVLFKIWATITIPVVVIGFGTNTIFAMSSETVFLSIMTYVSSLLFVATALRNGVNIDLTNALYIGTRPKRKK